MCILACLQVSVGCAARSAHMTAPGLGLQVSVGWARRDTTRLVGFGSAGLSGVGARGVQHVSKGFGCTHGNSIRNSTHSQVHMGVDRIPMYQNCSYEALGFGY